METNQHLCPQLLSDKPKECNHLGEKDNKTVDELLPPALSHSSLPLFGESEFSELDQRISVVRDAVEAARSSVNRESIDNSTQESVAEKKASLTVKK